MTDDDGMLGAVVEAKNRSTADAFRESLANWRDMNPLAPWVVAVINVATISIGAWLASSSTSGVLVAVGAILAVSGAWGLFDQIRGRIA